MNLNTQAQVPDLKPFTYLIDKAENQYSGSGYDWILSNAEDKQFLLFGEVHGVEDVPLLVEQLYEKLHSSGFKHLILEIDAVTAQQLSELSLEEFVSRYPHNIAFDYDGELQLMDKVLSMNPDEQVIWGVDQMITAIHAFQVLEKVAKGQKTKRICRGLHIKAALKGGRYISRENFEDMDQLEKLFENEGNEEGLSIVKQIRTSMEIYVSYFAATRGEISYEFSSAKREEYMKAWFDDFVKKAEKGRSLPRAIVKMGGAHTTYGIGPNNVPTLGDHLDKLARGAGTAVLSLGIAYAPADSEFLPKALFEGKAAMLVDNRSVIDQLDSTQLANLPQSFLNQLKYFDATVYLVNPQKSLKRVISVEDKRFKNRSIAKLVPYGLLIILNLSLLLPLIRWLFLRLFKRDTIRPNMSYYLVLFVLSLVIDLILVSQILSILMNTPVVMPAVMNPGLSFLIFMLLLLLSCVMLPLIKQAVKKELWTNTQARHFRLVAIGNLLLVVYMYYWNLGGMLA
ncbi:MAG: hypothetical protein HEP71_03510 [Roseivirga sp.]|nr:hypothetical protein [Roseivirga sp.]